MSSFMNRGAAGDDFTSRAEAFRRELLAHCYRMTGSVDDAEDLVQETYLRAWRSQESFQGRASLRTWLYRIATNACLTALERRARRPAPSDVATAGTEPARAPEIPGSGVTWLQPLPDALIAPAANDPATVVVTRDSVRLALIASLQLLSPKQRAVLILRDVLSWPASDVATTLGMTIGAVKSQLQRARGRLDEATPRMDDVIEPSHPQARALLEQYMAAFENADADAFMRLLRDDAVLDVPSSQTWFAGKRACVPYLAQVTGAPGAWRTLATAANGQPALAAYKRADDGGYEGFGVGVLTVTESGIARISVFSGIDLLTRFGLPHSLPARTAPEVTS